MKCKLTTVGIHVTKGNGFRVFNTQYALKKAHEGYYILSIRIESCWCLEEL